LGTNLGHKIAKLGQVDYTFPEKGTPLMPRIGRIVVKGEQAIYHVMSRTALDGYPLGDVEKETLVNLIKKKS
jgi:hypothetical protein